jgi:hypothetical protein
MVNPKVPNTTLDHPVCNRLLMPLITYTFIIQPEMVLVPNLMCLKLNTAGDTLWGPVAVLAGTAGLPISFRESAMRMGLHFVWQGSGEGGSETNLYARRLNADGGFAWSGLDCTNLC